MRELARAALLLLAVLACGAEPAPRHVILISLDTLRADRLGTYGHGLPTSPALDSLAQAGVVFEDASSTAPWTLPAHATLFTGLYPSRHGVVTARHALDRQVPTLAEILAERMIRSIQRMEVENDHSLAQLFFLVKTNAPHPSLAILIFLEVTPLRTFYLHRVSPQ